MALKNEHVKTGLLGVTGLALAIPAIMAGKAFGTVIGIGVGLGAAYTGAHYVVDTFGDKLINTAKEKFNAISSLNIRRSFSRTGTDSVAEVVPTEPAQETVVSTPRARRSKRA